MLAPHLPHIPRLSRVNNIGSRIASRIQASLFVPVAVLLAVLISTLGGSTTGSSDATDAGSLPAVAGVGLERPFIIIDGTASNVRVLTVVNGETIDAFTPANLPTTIAIDADSSNPHIEVVIENLDQTGTTSCAVGVAKDVVVSEVSAAGNGAVCAGTLP